MARADMEACEPARVEWDKDGDGDPVVFQVRPMDIYGYELMLEVAASVGPPGGDADRLGGRAEKLVEMVARHVVGWSNVVRAGQPAECSEENRINFFRSAANVVALKLVQDKLLEPFVPNGGDRPNASGGG